MAGVQEVWITYAAVNGTVWQTLDLTRNVLEPALWEGVLPVGAAAPADLRYMVQAVSGVGLVTLLTNDGEYCAPGIDRGAPVAPPLTTSTAPAAPSGHELAAGPAYRFALYHLMQGVQSATLFPVTVEEV